MGNSQAQGPGNARPVAKLFIPLHYSLSFRALARYHLSHNNQPFATLTTPALF